MSYTITFIVVLARKLLYISTSLQEVHSHINSSVKEKAILEKILENTPYTSIFDEFPKEQKEIEPSPEPKDKESIPEQEKEVLIAKSQPLQFQFHKRPSSEYNLNSL
jgi:hypothetical protein